MSNTMPSKFSYTETNAEGQNSTHLPHGWRLPQLKNSSCADAMRSPLLHRAQSILAAFSDDISALASIPNYLSTSAPRMMTIWVRCCGCDNLVNPSLTSEGRCPICSHSECKFCGRENVP